MTKSIILFTIVFINFSILAQENKHHLLIGTYTNTCDSDGIYVFDFDSTTGKAQLKSSTKGIVNPSYLTISEDKTKVYSVNEAGDKSQVSAFNYSSTSGTLELLNQVDAHGADPCYITATDENIIVATYSGGTISIFDKKPNGELLFQQVFKHNGKSINHERQEKSHLHMVQLAPDKKHLLATDLGADFIYSYKFNPKERNNTLSFGNAIKIKPGSGPRHFSFSPNGTYLYLINELDGSLDAFKYQNGNLKFIQETSIVANDFKGKSSAADIHVSADGKFLYATNRGDANTITCFEIKKNGKLKFKQTLSTLGKGPRNFTIDPSGNYVLVAHQYTNNVVIFKVDKQTGMLTDTGNRIELCSPVCLVFE